MLTQYSATLLAPSERQDTRFERHIYPYAATIGRHEYFDFTRDCYVPSTSIHHVVSFAADFCFGRFRIAGF